MRARLGNRGKVPWERALLILKCGINLALRSGTRQTIAPQEKLEVDIQLILVGCEARLGRPIIISQNISEKRTKGEDEEVVVKCGIVRDTRR